MERDRARPSESRRQGSASKRQAHLYAIAQELHRFVGQSPTSVARALFSGLVRATGVRSGRIFLTNENGTPNHCLMLADGRFTEYDEITAPPLHEQGLAGWVYGRRQATVISNTATDAARAQWADFPEVSAANSAMAVPIQVGARQNGALALFAEQPNHFGETDLALVTNLAIQAGTIIEHARLNTLVMEQQNTVDALFQTAYAINTLQDFDQILHTAVNHLAQASSYECAMLLLLDNGRLRPKTAAGFANADLSTSHILSPSDIPTVFQAIDAGRLIVAGDEKQLTGIDLLGFPKPITTCVFVPLSALGKNLGVVILASSEHKVLETPQILTIDALTNHLAIAVANHRLTQQTDRRLGALAFLNETGQAITSTLDLDRILHLLLEKVRELLQIDATSIALRDEQTGELVFEAASGSGAADVIGVRMKPGAGIAGWVAETGKPLLVRDVYNDPRFFEGIDRKTGIKTQAILCIPIVLKGRVVGVIEALNPDQAPFDEQAIELLTVLSGLAASAIENARLFAQVRSAEARYEGLFEDSANPIIITDLSGIIVEANRNACSLLGQPKEALRGTKLSHHSSPDSRSGFAETISAILDGAEAIFQTEMPSNGQRTAIEIRGKRIQVTDTSLIQWIGRDISAELELEKMRDDMVRMLIHDLRNPLSNIMNSLDVLDDVITEKDDSVSQEELLHIAKRSGQRMHQLINTILDIGRLETGQAILETRSVDLVPLLNEAIEFIKPQTDIREIELSASFEANMPKVELDRDMILRVILNLLDNASKFTQIGGAISLTARTQGRDVEVAVADNGPGIPAIQLPNIFEKFTRVRRKDSPEGTGLGLAFCKLAVESHQGHIWAESILGQGTTFRFTLPVNQPHPEV